MSQWRVKELEQEREELQASLAMWREQASRRALTASELVWPRRVEQRLNRLEGELERLRESEALRDFQVQEST